MMKPLVKRLVLLSLASLFSLGLVTALLKASSHFLEKPSYIEVNGPNIAHVPRTAKYVKYNGQTREIVRFAATISEAEQDCKCPNCCSGYCYVIIYTDAIIVTTPVIILSVLWLKCS
jgi:hypothetical protein